MLVKEQMRTSKTALWASNGIIQFKEYKGMMLTPRVIVDISDDLKPNYEALPTVVKKGSKVCYALPGGGNVYL